LLMTATPTGEEPTGTVPASAWAESSCILAVSKASSALLFRAVTKTRSPAGVMARRTGLQPAGPGGTIGMGGAGRARVTSTTMIAPLGLRGWAVAGSAPSGLHSIGQL